MNRNTKLSARFNVGSLFVLYLALVMAVYILPSLKITVPYIFAGLIMLVLLPIAIIKTENNMSYFVLLLVSTLVTAAIYLVNGIYDPIDTVNEVIRSIRFFMPVIWTVCALRLCSLKQQRNILIFFGILLLFILIKTTIALEKDPWIARILAQDKTIDTSEIYAYRRGNVGGFGFSYMIGVAALCLAWAAMRFKNIKSRICCIVGVALCFNYIIQSMYMMLLLLTSVGILLLLFFNTKSMLVKTALVFGSVVLVFSLVPFFKYLSEVFYGSLLSTKFSQFYAVLTGGGIDSLGLRPQLFMDALKRWLKSPIWGGYGTSVGTHSFIFSTLEATGLIGFFAFISCMYGSYKTISLKLKKRGNDTLLLSIVYIYILVLATLNPIGYVFEVAIASFFIAPLWSTLVMEANLL